MNYFVKRGEQEFGPYSLAALEQYVSQGNIARDDLARSEGMTEWMPVSSVLGDVSVSGQVQLGTVSFSDVPPAPIPAWRGRVKAFFLFLLGVVAVIVANIIGGMAQVKLGRSHPLLADMLYRSITTIVLIALFSLLLKFVGKERGSTLAAMGLPLRRGWLSETAIGVAIGFGLISLCAVAISLFGHLEFHATLNSVTERRFLEVTVLLLFGAMMEELMFRGYPFQRLVDAFGPVIAILILSVLFGAGHLGNPNAGGIKSWAFFNTIAVGAVFAIAYLKFRSLWLPFGIHFAWNFTLGVLYGLPVSGISMFSVIVRSTASGPHMLTGGAYGIEDSLTGAMAIVLGLVVVLILPKPRTEVLPFRQEPALTHLRPEGQNGI